MNELYEMLKRKLDCMRYQKCDTVEFDYSEVSQLFQFVCFMKQVKELVNWGDNNE